MPNQSWLILFHHLPPKPDYLRAKVRRRLQRLGALPLKNSVYVLPLRDSTAEDFEWLSQEIVAKNGEALVLDARFVSGITDGELMARFRAASDEAYESIVAAAHEASLESRPDGESDLIRERARLRGALEDATRTDFFTSDKRSGAERAVSELVTGSRPAADELERPRRSEASADYTGRTWVTRRGVFVDRMASAWLVRRVIDPSARFRFTDELRVRSGPGELSFDIAGGDFTHRGDMCTFEVLGGRFAPNDPAIAAIAEIVHDMDLKDEKFARPETPGVSAILRGIAESTDDDDARIAAAAGIFDSLYRLFSSAR